MNPRHDPHPISEEDLTAYLDGELPPEQAARVEQRLAEDSDFAQRLHELRLVRDALQSLDKVRAPSDLPAEIAARLERLALLEEDWDAAPASRSPAERSRAAVLLRLTAAAAVIALTLTAGYLLRWSQDRADRLAPLAPPLASRQEPQPAPAQPPEPPVGEPQPSTAKPSEPPPALAMRLQAEAPPAPPPHPSQSRDRPPRRDDTEAFSAVEAPASPAPPDQPSTAAPAAPALTPQPAHTPPIAAAPPERDEPPPRKPTSPQPSQDQPAVASRTPAAGAAPPTPPTEPAAQLRERPAAESKTPAPTAALPEQPVAEARGAPAGRALSPSEPPQAATSARGDLKAPVEANRPRARERRLPMRGLGLQELLAQREPTAIRFKALMAIGGDDRGVAALIEDPRAALTIHAAFPDSAARARFVTQFVDLWPRVTGREPAPWDADTPLLQLLPCPHVEGTRPSQPTRLVVIRLTATRDHLAEFLAQVLADVHPPLLYVAVPATGVGGTPRAPEPLPSAESAAQPPAHTQPPAEFAFGRLLPLVAPDDLPLTIFGHQPLRVWFALHAHPLPPPR